MGIWRQMITSIATLERHAEREVARAQALPTLFGGETIGQGSLPPAAQRYLYRAGVFGRERVQSFAVVMSGRIRNGADAPWMPLVMRQYNRVDNPARIVYLTVPRSPMSGVDSLIEGSGRMLIRLANLIPIADSQGPEMSVSALVTFLNDLVLCPLAYFSLPLRWREIDANSFELSFDHAGFSVAAVVTVDDEGNLRNWRTDHRYAEVKGRNLPDRWSTPFEGSQELAGLRIPQRGVGVHDYDGNPFVYVELNEIRSLELNPPGLPRR